MVEKIKQIEIILKAPSPIEGAKKKSKEKILKGLVKAFINKHLKSEFRRSVLTLFSGASFAQLIPIFTPCYRVQ